MDGHPTVSEVYERVRREDSRISLGTLYRTISLLERYDLIERYDFGILGRGGREGARFESAGGKKHHDHLIDVDTGEVLEFREERIEELQREVAERMGYELQGHRLELYAVKRKE
jgi:Fur family ferric uptake transcriptional regulator